MATTFDAIVETGTFTTMSIKNGYIWTGLGISLAIILALYVLRSIGLFTLAKRQNVKHAFLAWIPLVWFYILCKLLGKSRFFNMPYEKAAIWLCIVFAVSEILTLVVEFLMYFPLFQYALIEGGMLYIGSGEQVGEELVKYLALEGGLGIYVSKRILPFGMTVALVNRILEVLNLISMFFDLAVIVITISAYFAFFRKYLPRHFMLASLLSVFIPITFAPFVFACRNKEPVDYNEYIRSRYQGYQNPYQNPYNNPHNGPYNNPYNQGGYYGGWQPRRPEEPFSEFSGKDKTDSSEPFSEFDQKKNNDPFDEFNDKN
ncbi:MAG: hypothetical protein J6V71_02555 [Clostridia bacterium]|nr:hypothetical protein [Clostridia bacterium]